MKHLSWLLCVGLSHFSGLWMSWKVTQCQIIRTDVVFCYDTTSRKTCLTPIFDVKHLVRKTFEEASHLCKVYVPGSSLIIVNSSDSQRGVEGFIRWQVLENETIITDAQMHSADGQRRLTGLHRNKWIWNSTGAALTYTNWKNGFRNQSSNERCICLVAKCSEENEETICETEYDRRWRTCNCSNNYVVICQKEVESDALSTETADKNPPSTPADITSSSSSFPSDRPTTVKSRSSWPSSTLPSSMATSLTSETNHTKGKHSKASKTSSTFKPLISSVTVRSTTNVANTAGETERKTLSSSSFAHKPSDDFAGDQTTAVASPSTSPSTGLFKSLLTTEILLILLLLVAVTFIVATVILIIRKRRNDRRNKESTMVNMKKSEVVSSVYATVVRDSRSPEDTAPVDNAIYAEVNKTQRPTPSNSAIYASVQLTSEAIDMGENVVYADLDLPQKTDRIQ